MEIFVAISTVADGNMLIPTDQSNKVVAHNRSVWLASNNIAMIDTTRIRLVYTDTDYRRYHEITLDQKSDGMSDGDVIVSDALITRNPHHAIFLALADCIGAVIYDPIEQILMLSHLGRQALEQNGGYESVKHLVDHYGCDPMRLVVQLTPSAGLEGYPLFSFDNRSLKDVAISQLQSAGILSQNITDDQTDTIKDLRYYSHSEFLKGNRPDDGRFAVVAMMTHRTNG